MDAARSKIFCHLPNRHGGMRPRSQVDRPAVADTDAALERFVAADCACIFVGNDRFPFRFSSFSQALPPTISGADAHGRAIRFVSTIMAVRRLD